VEVCKPPNQRHPSYSLLLRVLSLCSEGLDAPKSRRKVLEPAAAARQVLEQAATARQNSPKIIERF